MAARPIRHAVFAALLALALGSVAISEMAAQKKRQVARTGPEHPIAGGTFEASGVVHVAGTDGVLFVDDGRNDSIFWMRIDRGGQQLEPAVPIPLGLSIGDLEGITTDGTWYYVVGSQSKREFVDGVGLVRFRFDPSTLRISNAEGLSGLRTRLLSQLPSVAAAAGSQEDGFNIEGLAADRPGHRLLLGLRSPLIDGQALIIPVDLTSLGAHWAPERVAVLETDLLRLPLGEAGIRSVEFDDIRGRYWIIAAATRGKSPFTLWDWRGGSGTSAMLTADSTFDARLKPEGVATMNGRLDFRLIVFDTSRFLAVQEE